MEAVPEYEFVAKRANYDETHPNIPEDLRRSKKTRLELRTASFWLREGISLFFDAEYHRIPLLSRPFWRERGVQIGDGLPLGG